MNKDTTYRVTWEIKTDDPDMPRLLQDACGRLVSHKWQGTGLEDEGVHDDGYTDEDSPEATPGIVLFVMGSDDHSDTQLIEWVKV